MALAFVGNPVGNTSAGGTASITLTGVTAHSAILVVGVAFNVTASSLGFTDNNASNEVTDAYWQAASNNYSLFAGSVLDAAAGNHTIAISGGGTVNNAILAVEVSGVATTAAFDKTASRLDDEVGMTPSSGVTATTAQADEVLIGVASTLTSDTLSMVSGWTKFLEVVDGTYSRHSAITAKIVSTAAAYAAEFTQTDNVAVPVLIATYKAAASGPTLPVVMHHHRLQIL